MNNSSFLFATVIVFCTTLTLWAILYVLFLTHNVFYFIYLDTALVGLGSATVLLWTRKYMVQSYSLDAFHDFFPMDALLILLWLVMLGTYFIVA